MKRLRRYRCAWCCRWLGPLRRSTCPWAKGDPVRLRMVSESGRCEWWWNG